jgi:peptidyl-prolyl cis-trans isomerase C
MEQQGVAMPIRTMLCWILASTLVLPAAAQAQSEAAAKVNGVEIPVYRLDAAVRARIAQGQPDTAELRESLRDELINRELITQEAIRRGLHKDPNVAGRIELERQSILIGAYLEEYLRANPITDEVLRKEYNRVKPQLPGREYRARHILLDDEAEARAIIAEIMKGASFQKLAAERSKDTGSAQRGGDLDWSPATGYVRPFGEALARLKKGQMTTTPVQTQFGWHVIRLEDERTLKVPSFEEAKPTLQQMARNQAIQKVLTDLRDKARIE